MEEATIPFDDSEDISDESDEDLELSEAVERLVSCDIYADLAQDELLQLGACAFLDLMKDQVVMLEECEDSQAAQAICYLLGKLEQINMLISSIDLNIDDEDESEEDEPEPLA